MKKCDICDKEVKKLVELTEDYRANGINEACKTCVMKTDAYERSLDSIAAKAINSMAAFKVSAVQQFMWDMKARINRE